MLPFTSHGRWGFRRAFPRNSHLGSFCLQLSVVMAQAKLFCCPVLGGTWGPEVWAMSVPNHDKVSGQQFLISHLLQYNLAFFGFLVLFILFLMALNHFVGGEDFCAHC